MTIALLALACTIPACSNDPGQLGDERVCWDAVPDPEHDLATYEAANQFGDTVIVNPTVLCLTVAGTSLVAPNEAALVRVRACDTGGLCGGWSNAVEFQPWTCLRNINCYDSPRFGRVCDACEDPCYAGAPRRAPWRALCE